MPTLRSLVKDINDWLIMKQVVLKIHPKDNVLVALKNLAKGETISFEGEEYILQDTIGAKHKFFTHDVNAGDEVIMYGVLVGKAQNFIPRGGLMTTANIKHAAQPYDYRGSNFHGMHLMFQNLKQNF